MNITVDKLLKKKKSKNKLKRNDGTKNNNNSNDIVVHSHNINPLYINNQINKNRGSRSPLINPLFKSALENYDIHQIKIQQLLKKTNYIEFIPTNSLNENDEIKFFDLDDKLLFKSKIEILAVYIPSSPYTQTKNNLFKWGWSIPGLNKKDTNISQQIFEYAQTLDPIIDYLLKYILTNSELKINNEYQLDLFISIASMLIKKPFIHKLSYDLFKYVNEKILYYYNNEKNNNEEINEEYCIKYYLIIKEWF